VVVMKKPLVSIIIPTYNRAHLSGETLDSVLAQTYTNWECMIVDDGCTDNTAELLKTYCEKDVRFQYHHRPQNRPKGANACRNYGFELSRGEYIQWLDSDDYISPNKISDQINMLKTIVNGHVATCKWGVFVNDVEGCTFINDLESYKSFENSVDFIEAISISRGYFPIHAYLIKRPILSISGLWNEYLSINQDSEFIIRVLVNVNQILFCEDAYVLYRNAPKEKRVSNLDSNVKKNQDLINSIILI